MAKWIVRIPYEGMGYIPLETDEDPKSPGFKQLVNNRVQSGNVHVNKPSFFKQERIQADPADDNEYAKLVRSIEDVNRREGVNILKLSSHLDKIADGLQEQGLMHEAEALDAVSNAIEHYSMPDDMFAADPKEEDTPAVIEAPVEQPQSPVESVLGPYEKPTELQGDDLEVFEEVVKNIIESNGFTDVDIKQPFIVLVRGKGSFIKNALRSAFPKLRMPKAVAVMRYGTRNCGLTSDDIKAV